MLRVDSSIEFSGCVSHSAAKNARVLLPTAIGIITIIGTIISISAQSEAGT